MKRLVKYPAVFFIGLAINCVVDMNMSGAILAVVLASVCAGLYKDFVENEPMFTRGR